jgi:SAM-dependent methyltransferase
MSGEDAYRTFVSLLARIGKSFADFRTVLDFGCGCGRIIRAMKRNEPDIAFHGTDIDAEAIAWLKGNYGRIGEFSVLPHRPVTSYADNSFDFIYGISVFTHLPEDMQFEWLAELSRIAKPGAVLLLTTHGQKRWGRFTGKEADIMKTKGFYYREAPATDGLPEFYKNTYHSHSYIQQNWSRYLDIARTIELGIGNHQDVVLAYSRQKEAGEEIGGIAAA